MGGRNKGMGGREDIDEENEPFERSDTEVEMNPSSNADADEQGVDEHILSSDEAIQNALSQITKGYWCWCD